MKQKYIVPGIVVFGIVVLSFGLVQLFNSFAQNSEDIICRSKLGFSDWSTTPPIGTNKCAWTAKWSVKCPSGAPNVYINQSSSASEPSSVDCLTYPQLGSKGAAIKCNNPQAHTANEQTYWMPVSVSGFCANYNIDTAAGEKFHSVVECPTGYNITLTEAGTSKCVSKTSSPPPSQTHDIVCADPASHTQSELQYCTVSSASQTVALWCTYAGEVIRRDGLKEVCIPLANIASTEKKCSFENRISHRKIEIYAAECPATSSDTKETPKPTVTPGPEATEPPLQCPATKGLCRKGKVQECLAVCPATWEFVLPEGFTPMPSRLLGEDYVTGVSSDGIYLEGESATDVEAEKAAAEPQIIKETIVIEKEIMVEVTPVEVPQTADGAACESFQNNITTALQERLVVLDTFQKAGEDAASANADIKKASQQNIKAGVKELRDINKKNTTGFQCSVEHLREVASAVKGLDDVVIAQARQNLAIMKKEEKVQPQYFGIRQDITTVENALKRIPDDKRGEMQTQIQYFEQCKNDFEELVLAEDLILASEIQDTAAQCKTAKTQIATLLKAKSSQPKVLKKETSVKKATLKKKAAKKSLKEAKKSKKTKKAKTKKTKNK